jgi:hypothetical protein
MSLRTHVAACGALLCCALPALAGAQASTWRRTAAGSERELYERALGLAGVSAERPWSLRPLSPSMGLGIDSSSRAFAWMRDSSRATRGMSLTDPVVGIGYNGAFPWGMHDGPVWAGRGLTAWASGGARWARGGFSIQLEPLVSWVENRDFPLQGGAGLRDPVRPDIIDLPQRPQDGSFARLDPGNSYVRLDWRGSAVGLSTAPMFWGPGVRNAILFTDNAAGFPHLFAGTSHPVRTPLGLVHGQLVWGRLEESPQSPDAPGNGRLGAGIALAWMPVAGLEVGGARFWHRVWPAHPGLQDLLVPFGSLSRDVEFFDGGPADNQLASLFLRVAPRGAGFELFGEYARNDRSGNFRDLLVEPEHNAGWLVGFQQLFGTPSASAPFWTARVELASARIGELQTIGRSQSTLYDHSVLRQGHTQRGKILGSPLLERSGGVELSVDRWSPRGRIGVLLVERQMPSDLLVGMPRGSARTQWDLALSITRVRGRSRMHAQVGNVWDLNRVPGRDGSNSYVRHGWSPSLAR